MTQRLERIIRMLVMLQAGVRCNALRISKEAGVHRRTVFRDFAALRSLGFPISFDARTGCYQLARGASQAVERDAKNFSRLLEMYRDALTSDSATDATVSEDPAKSSSITNQHLWFDLYQNETLLPDVLASLVAAIKDNRRITAEISTVTVESLTVQFLPTELTFKGHEWQVSGSDEAGLTVQYDVNTIVSLLDSVEAEEVPRTSEQAI